MLCLKKVEIRLSLAENVKTFVNIVNRYEFDMDLRAGRHVVDAKSILGIFSLDLSKPITLEVDWTVHGLRSSAAPAAFVYFQRHLPDSIREFFS